MKRIAISIIYISLLVPGGVVFGQQLGSASEEGAQGSSGSGVTIPNPIKVDSISGLLKLILDVLLIFAVPIVVFFIIYAGFLYVTARGKPDTITQAHRALLYAIIGGLLILGANVLIDVLQGTVNEIKGG